MQLGFLLKAKRAVAANNRCNQRAPITVNFRRVYTERRGGAILIDISMLYIKLKNSSFPLLVILAYKLSLDLMLYYLAHIGNKE